MLKIGLTGGIGSGKSTVARLFEQRRIDVIDTDRIARELVAPGQPALAAIVQAFGPKILQDDGRLNRTELRRRVFRDPEAKKNLEAILHPRVFTEMNRQADLCRSPYCILAVPLLVETDALHRVDRVLVVDCPEQIQIERVQHRDGLSDNMIRRILASQATRRERLQAADDVIVNDGDLGQLERQVDELHRFYLQLSHDPETG
ncbi:dephospho-CoA kinase [Methylohalobius crimeensis]|uniref:dephospho-CoA kinase n=1 Tax=Methylohalobius crimeensis TaxID=244365 RepID=UPI0003B5948D|nr:dephospho-CoA kinase [Methylohalobius crimeensis]